MMASGLPYWRLSGFYFFYFATLGIIVPYWGLYLQWEGFSARQIGELSAILLASRIIAPNIWAWIGDKKNQRMPIVRIASLFTLLVFSGVFLQQSYLWFAFIMVGFSFFWNASLPQVEVTTLQYLGEKPELYSRIRLWGSIGFIVIVLSLGIIIQKFEANIVPYALLITLSGIWLTSLMIPEVAIRHQQHNDQSIKQILKQPSILIFLVICFLMLVAHGPYYTFYSIYLESYGYSRSLIGVLWSIGVLAEIGIFLLMHRGLARFSMKNVLLISCLLSAVRWLIIGCYPEQLGLLILAQTLHAASFGMFHAVAISWIYTYFTGKHQCRGQAIYSSVSFGAGGAAGSLLSGYLWISPGANTTFTIAAMIAFSAFIIGFFGLNRTDR